MKKHVVSFSGGKDSTAMLLMMIERNMHIDLIVCVDTTKEFPDMYKHIEKVKEYIKPRKIDIVSFDFDYYFSDHVKTKGKNKGKKGYGFPDFRNRWCTTYKVYAIRKIMKDNFNNDNIIEYHGIALDEERRAKSNNDRDIRYPLIEWGITERQALKYCYDLGFDWGGLYEKFHRVSCWCCPLSRIGELRILYSDYPELWNNLVELDKKSYRKFRSDYSVADLGDRFKKENNTKSLFQLGCSDRGDGGFGSTGK